MNVELLIQNEDGGTLFSPATIEGIQLSLERKGTAGKLTFKCIQDNVLKVMSGGRVRLKVDNKNVFYGFIFSRQLDKDGVLSVTCYDQLIYLVKNKDTYVLPVKPYLLFLNRLQMIFS